MDLLILTIESDDLDALQPQLDYALLHEEGVTIHTGGGNFTVDVVQVNRFNDNPEPICGCDWHSGVPGSRPDDHDRFQEEE